MTKTGLAYGGNIKMTGIEICVNGAWVTLARPDMAYVTAYARMQAIIDRAPANWRAYRLSGLGAGR